MLHRAAPIRPLLAAALLGLLSACAQTPSRPAPPQVSPVLAAMLSRAAGLMDSGKYAAAADLYARLGPLVLPGQREALLVRAADAWLQVPNLNAAAAALERVQRARLAPEDAWHARLVEAEILLGRARLDPARTLLAGTPPAALATGLRARWLGTQAQVLRLSGDLPASARALSTRDSLLQDPGQRLAGQLLLVHTLALLDDPTLDALRGTPPDRFGGWIDLVRLLRSPQAPGAGLTLGLARWQALYPDHPALPELPREYLAALERGLAEPHQIAVLLPGSGRYARVSAVLSAGLLAAYYAVPPAQRPQLRFYDVSDPTEIGPLLQRAVAEGAEVAIGPLQKEAVQQLAQAGGLAIPVLALNRIDTDTPLPARLYQFGLAPEDEAYQAAEQAWHDGATRALALVPQGDWGARLLQGFRGRWEALGGRLVAYQTYDPAQHDFTLPIRRLLQAERDPRPPQAALIAGITERPPGGTDALFLAASARVARQLWPQLQFHRSGDLPAYTTSHIQTRRFRLPEDLDLVGLRFPDIPWLLQPEGRAPITPDALPPDLLADAQMARLFAMGMDSLRLLPALSRLRRLPGTTFPGATGDLGLDALNQVHRRLVWARMTAQGPRPQGLTPQPDEGAAAAAGATAAPDAVTESARGQPH